MKTATSTLAVSAAPSTAPSAAASPEHHIRNLHDALRASGTFAPAGRYHAIWVATVLALYAASYGGLLLAPSLPVRIACLGVAGVMIIQMGLFGHEVGHGAVTADRRWRSALGHFAYSFLGGLSYSYWLSSHSVHHNHPNTEGVDPDAESGAYALYEAAARRSQGAARVVARMQPLTLILGFLLWGGTIKVDGAVYVARNPSRRTAIDAACLAAHVALWLIAPLAVLPVGAVIVNYAIVTMLNGIYMGGILVVPHVGTGSQEPGEAISFFERQVRFSRNYDSSWLGTLLCGGLNLQIEHHLLPHVPCVRLRRARPVIAAYCARHGLPYRQSGYGDAWRLVIAHLRRMARIAEESTRPEASLEPVKETP